MSFRTLRDVPLLPAAADALRSWLAALPSWCAKNPLGLVFPRERGAHGARKPPQHWHAWVAAARLGRRLRFHDLRHTCACILLNGQLGRKWSFEEVREMLGHADIKTTQLYGVLTSSTLMRAALETAATSPAAPTP
ncbi:MAG: tyrosine-type recombinase/integrase [Polyangiaceae bacterium]